MVIYGEGQGQGGLGDKEDLHHQHHLQPVDQEGLSEEKQSKAQVVLSALKEKEAQPISY